MLPRMTKKSSQVMSKGFILEQNEFFLAQDHAAAAPEVVAAGAGAGRRCRTPTASTSQTTFFLALG